MLMNKIKSFFKALVTIRVPKEPRHIDTIGVIDASSWRAKGVPLGNLNNYANITNSTIRNYYSAYNTREDYFNTYSMAVSLANSNRNGQELFGLYKTSDSQISLAINGERVWSFKYNVFPTELEISNTTKKDEKYHSFNDEPAIVFGVNKAYQIQVWFKDGTIHRDNGPAIFSKDFSLYVTNGDLNKIDGPTLIIIDDDNYHQRWYVNNQDITKELYVWAEENAIDMNFLLEEDKTLIKMKWA